jgi:lipid-binding SYLF domain-containing protein
MKLHRSWQSQIACLRGAAKVFTIPLLILTFFATALPAAAADDSIEARQLVERSTLTFESFLTDPNMGVVRDWMKDARGVFIAPQILKGAFILGASGGSGVLLVRGEAGKPWSPPAFYTLGGVSFGLQAGGESSEVVFLVMTDRGVSALQGSNVKLGVDASVAIGPVGAGVEGATAALSADIVAFSRSQGLYGGLSIEGSVVAVRDSWNSAYYGKEVAPTDILIRRTVSNPHAEALVSAVTKVARPQ